MLRKFVDMSERDNYFEGWGLVIINIDLGIVTCGRVFCFDWFVVGYMCWGYIRLLKD